MIYKINDKVLCRICQFDDCDFRELHWRGHEENLCINCSHSGDVHFHCIRHKEIELAIKITGNKNQRYSSLICVVCEQEDGYNPPLRRLSDEDIITLKQKAKSLINSNKFKSAKMVRLDDYYVPEISEKKIATKDSNYWVSYDVKETVMGKPLLVLYLGNREDKSKAQFFIEPETQKLSHDHKHGNPLSILSRIEVEFKDGKIEVKDKN